MFFKNNPFVKVSSLGLLAAILMAMVLLAACANPTVVPQEPTPGSPAEEPGLPPATGPTPEPTSPDDPVVSPADPQVPVTPEPQPWQPVPGDKDLKQGNVFIEGHDILVLEKFPPEFLLNLNGNLPTPCHELRVEVSEPDEEDRIHVMVYSLVDPGQICTQVLKPFDVSVSLGTFSSGKYAVWMNGEEIGEVAP